ncbi:MAG TPA: 4Fe-4S dicluster domain-containing protein [Planctomycetota bacterium]|nr:4Fe-4S dicluster domain-containing protein [Planctomycetota bacterium]
MTNVIQKRVLTNLDRCIECGSCAAACHVSHAGMPAVLFAIRGQALLPMICRQCKDAPCVIACPVEAMVQDEHGVARRRLFRCIGCGSCARACPFGVLPNELAGVPDQVRSVDRLSGHQTPKCDLCCDRTECDADVVTRCVAACPAGALSFADEHKAEEEGLTMMGGRTTGEHPFKRR